jgi:hypothetical protein
MIVDAEFGINRTVFIAYFPEVKVHFTTGDGADEPPF